MVDIDLDININISIFATAAERGSFVSAVISSIISVVIFASLRFFNAWFIATPMNIILGGFAGSWLFVFGLTSVSNIEMVMFGPDFQAVLIPEIAFSLIFAVISCGMVHRVCATTCILFSIVALYFINRISTKYHSKGNAVVEPVPYRKVGGKKNK